MPSASVQTYGLKNWHFYFHNNPIQGDKYSTVYTCDAQTVQREFLNKKCISVETEMAVDVNTATKM